VVSEAEKEVFIQENLADICASVQSRINSILLHKLEKAVRQTGIKEVCLAGGVSANSDLRKSFQELGKQRGWKCYVPDFEYCTDNAGMIAITAYYKFLENKFSPFNLRSSARADWE
jgi:N6-L-threonylcarbamoyladenine synthase